MARISEIKQVRIVNCNQYRNPFYLRWVNVRGGVDYWLFEKMQDIDTETEELGIYNKYVEDYETTTESTKSLGKRKREMYTIGVTNVDENDYNGIVGVVASPLVEYYNGTDWITVVVMEGTFKKSTFDTRYDLEMEIMFPEKLTQW